MTPKKRNAERCLGKLYKTGSTSRVLNLVKLHNEIDQTRNAIQHSFFKSPPLNRAFISKHRLRKHELEIFNYTRSQTTKLIIPIDRKSLTLGGQFLFVNQPDFMGALGNFAGHRIEDNQHDVEMLNLLDAIPSLDPFILREWVRRRNLVIDARYFELDNITAQRMESFVLNELNRLVSQAVGANSSNTSGSRLVQKLLASNYDSDLDPFRTVFRFSVDVFPELMFCWKGFLYYKWLATDIEADLAYILRELATIKVSTTDSEVQRSVLENRKAIHTTAIRQVTLVRGLIGDYDLAFDDLVNHGSAKRFREFLIDSPSQFMHLGESIGILRHIIQFWRYQFPKGPTDALQPDEYTDLMRDFQDGLGVAA